MKTGKKVIYKALPAGDLDMIQPLWELLRQHHWQKSPFFKDRYERLEFAERKKALLEKDELFIDTAHLAGSGEMAGYCVSSVARRQEKVVGEIDSILVAPAFHKLGIGIALMNRALAWLDDQKASSIKVVVAAGNEEVFPFYEAFGFYPFSNVLMKRKAR